MGLSASQLWARLFMLLQPRHSVDAVTTQRYLCPFLGINELICLLRVTQRNCGNTPCYHPEPSPVLHRAKKKGVASTMGPRHEYDD